MTTKKTFTESELKEAVMSHPAGTTESKTEFLKKLGIQPDAEEVTQAFVVNIKWKGNLIPHVDHVGAAITDGADNLEWLKDRMEVLSVEETTLG